MKLRPYQEECVAAHWRYFQASSGNPLFVVPTAGGKSHIMAAFLERSIEAWPKTRALVLTHVKELIEQNHEKYLGHVGAYASAGIYSAGIGRRDTQDQVIFAGIQSLWPDEVRGKKRAAVLGAFDLVLVDECLEAGTLVDGRPIEQVAPGDRVSCYDHRARTVVEREVLAKSVRFTARPVVEITTEFGVLRCTDNHPVYADGQYQEAASLSVGQSVRVLRVRSGVHAKQESVQGDAAKREPSTVLEDVFLPTKGPSIFDADEGCKSYAIACDQKEGIGHAVGHEAQAERARGQGASHAKASAQAAPPARTRLEGGEGPSHWKSKGVRGDMVLGRLVLRAAESLRRGRRHITRLFARERTRRPQGQDLVEARILHVAIHEQGRDGASGLRPVFNLQVDGCENFFADGVLVHNCHLIPKAGQGRYRSYISALREINPHAKVLGYTATHYRLDGGYLHKGEGRIFTDVAYEVPVENLVLDGYLSPLVAKEPKLGLIDTDGIRTVSGDFKKDDLEDAATAGHLVEDAVNEMVRYGREEKRSHWLVFACGIEHAKMVVAELDIHRVSNRTIFGHTGKAEREQSIDDFKAGKYKALVNVGVLTTGFDAPMVDLLAILRPTQSAGLYVQIMGRGMRLAEGKTNCLVLDYGGNVMRHGPINRVRPKRQGGPTEEAPAKRCPMCRTVVPAALRKCSECGFEFPPPEERVIGKQTRKAGDLAPIDLAPQKPTWCNVSGVYYRVHRKLGKPPSLRVDYLCGMSTFSEWVCFEHQGYARRKAVQWWLNRAGPGERVPDTVIEALERQKELTPPARISVVPDGNYHRIRGCSWSKEPAPQ